MQWRHLGAPQDQLAKLWSIMKRLSDLQQALLNEMNACVNHGLTVCVYRCCAKEDVCMQRA